jgi:hypothetical protein
VGWVADRLEPGGFLFCRRVWKREAGLDLAVISEKSRKLKDFPVETNGQALVEAIRMIPGHKHLVMEEGLQSAWLYETLRPHVDELVVAGIT